MEDVHEVGLTNFRWSREADESCSSAFDRCKSIHRLPLSKTKQHKTRRAYESNCNLNKNGECEIPQTCRRQSISQSLWGRPRWEATLPRCSSRPRAATPWTTLRWQSHNEYRHLTSSSQSALLPATSWRWILSWRTDPRTHRRKVTLFADAASRVWDRKRDFEPYSNRTQIIIVSVNQHVRPTRLSNKRHWITQAAKIEPRTENLCVESLEKWSDKATAIHRRVSFSHVRMKVHIVTPRSSNSKLYRWWQRTHSIERNKFGAAFQSRESTESKTKT